MKHVGLAILLFLALCTTASAKPKPLAGWKRYSETWCDIFYPQAFTPRPIQASRTSSEGVDSAAFLSPAREVEFYVFSPQWSGHASALDVDPGRERLTSKEITHSDYRTGDGQAEKDAIEDTWLGITALDGSYVRFVHQHSNRLLNTAQAFGIQCKDMVAYRRCQADYDRFRKSLMRYAD